MDELLPDRKIKLEGTCYHPEFIHIALCNILGFLATIIPADPVSRKQEQNQKLKLLLHSYFEDLNFIKIPLSRYRTLSCLSKFS